MKILIADKFSEEGIAVLEATGHQTFSDASLKGDSLIAALSEFQPEALVVRSTKVPAEALDANKKLEIIVRAGAGYDTIDVAGASDRGIYVANCPGKNAAAVAELAFGLIISIDRKIPDNVAQMRAGEWNKAGFSKAEGLKGRTLGLIGLGNIGKEMIKRARGFGMPIAAWSRSLTDDDAARLGIIRWNSPEEVAANCDIISVHVASNEHTKNIIGRDFIEALPEGSTLINTARGAVIDEDALAWGLDHKNIQAGLDVFVGEPSAKTGEVNHRFMNHPNVYFTHHIGASTAQATDAIGRETVRVLVEYAETGAAPNCVNLAANSEAGYLLTVRHLDQVGVLAAVLDQMRLAGWNVQEMENLIFAGSNAACARIWFAGEIGDGTINRIESISDVIAVSVIQLD